MKLVRKIKISLLIILLLSCSSDKEVELQELSKLYVDLLIVEDLYINTDSLEYKRNELFEQYSISEELYDSTFKRFSYDREKWDLFFKLSNEYLDTLKSNLNTKKLKSEI